MYLALVAIVGLPGNCIIIVVFGRKVAKTTSTILILSLAADDLFVCATMPLTIYHSVFHVHENSQSLIVCQIYTFSSYFVIYTSILLCVVIAFDRFFAVTRPVKKVITPYRAKLVVAGCVLFSMIIHALLTARVHIKQLYINGTVNGTLKVYERCESSASTTGSFWFSIIYGVSYYIYLFIITILYIRLYMAIRKRMIIRAKMGIQPSPASVTENGVQESAVSTVSSRTLQPALKAKYSNSTSVDCSSTSRSQRHGVKHDHLVSDNAARHNDQREAPDTAVKKKVTVASNKTTNMLFLVTAVTFVTWMPSIFSHALEVKGTNDTTTYFLIRNLYLLNHASNPVIYCLVNKRFREDFIYVCRKFSTCRS